MRLKRYMHMITAMLFSLIMLWTVPAATEQLTTAEVTSIDVPGTFTLILYGGRHFRDVESVALLDLEGDLYAFEPYAPDFDFRVMKGLSAKDAFERAQRFLAAQYGFRRSVLGKIMDSSGKTIGYEMRPLYDPLTFGESDVLDVSYSQRSDGKVRVYIHLKPSVERQLYGGDGARDDGH